MTARHTDTKERQPVAVWFEIPATNFDRAARFYERILGVTLRREAIGPMTLGVFPYEQPNASGCIISGPGVSLKPGERSSTSTRTASWTRPSPRRGKRAAPL